MDYVLYDFKYDIDRNFCVYDIGLYKKYKKMKKMICVIKMLKVYGE